MFQFSKTSLVVLSVALSLYLVTIAAQGAWAALTSSSEDHQLIVSCDVFEEILEGKEIPCGDFFRNMSAKLEYTGIDGYEASFHKLSHDGLVMVISFEADAGSLFALRNSLMETSYEFHLAGSLEKVCLAMGCEGAVACRVDEGSPACQSSALPVLGSRQEG